MSETITKSPEQTPLQELPQPPTLNKSAELFHGDINDAVKTVQQQSGFEIDETWWNKNIQMDGSVNDTNKILENFDREFKKAYEAEYWRSNGAPESQITSIQSHEDYETDLETSPQQINGINIPYEVLESEGDPKIWAVEEQKRRLDYVFNKAEFHLNHTFTIGSETYSVDSITYTGTDGNYETLEVKIMNVETGEVSDYMEPDRINQLIRRAEAAPAETPEERKQQALEAFNERFADDEDAPSVAEFEAWLENHPELQDTPEQENDPKLATSTSQQDDNTEDVNTQFAEITNTENWAETAPDTADAKEEIDTALEAFDQLTEDQPEYETYRSDYIDSLHAKIAGKYSPELAEQLMSPLRQSA